MLEVPFVNDKRNGQAKGYFETGPLLFTVDYKNDLPEKGFCYGRDGSAIPLTNVEIDNFGMGLKVKCK
jgi:antitoxin component YwqK of YwqJK toxin-antitoxin module